MTNGTATELDAMMDAMLSASLIFSLAGFVVPLWRPEVIDEIATVSTEEAMATARRLARTEGLFAGTSTGGNVAVAIELGLRLGPDATVVTVMCDSGMKYLSTPLYG